MEYLLKVTAVVTLFYIIYKLFLQRDTFFESNRWFLLLGLVSSFLIPFIIIPIYIEYVPVNLSGFVINEITSTETIQKPFHILDYLPILYGLGVLFFSVRFIIQLLSLAKIIYRNKGVKKDGFVFIKTQNKTSPFSFFKWIVYNPENFNQTELEHIIEHEKTHARQYHSVDILISQLFCIIFWFNPFMWFYNKDLKQNLEFIADKRTLNQYNCKKSYQYTLLKTSMPSHQMALSNHFYNSLIKKRIVMLHKSKSKKINQLKYALVIPVLLGFLISCNTEVSDPTPESNALLPNVDVNPSSITIRHPANGFPLFIVDGKEIPHDEFEKLNEDDVFSINVLKDEKYTSKYGDKAKNGVVEIITKGNAGSFEGKPINGVKVIGFETKTGSTEKRIVVEGKLSNGENPIDFRAKPNSATTIGHKIEINKDEHPLVVVDGKELPFEDFERLDSDKVETMTFLKAENATKKYGNKAKNGVIEIITKK